MNNLMLSFNWWLIRMYVLFIFVIILLRMRFEIACYFNLRTTEKGDPATRKLALHGYNITPSLQPQGLNLWTFFFGGGGMCIDIKLCDNWKPVNDNQKSSICLLNSFAYQYTSEQLTEKNYTLSSLMDTNFKILAWLKFSQNCAIGLQTSPRMTPTYPLNLWFLVFLSFFFCLFEKWQFIAFMSSDQQ